MARTGSNSITSREKLLADLTTDQKAAFLKLEALFRDERDDFDWHYQVGCNLQRISPREADAKHLRHGDKWFGMLAELFHRSSAPLYKKLRFAVEFQPAQVKQLQDWQPKGMTWTHVTHAFTQQDRKKRWKLLQKAAAKGWNSEELKYEIKNQVTSRHPEGGRPPRKSASGSSAAALQKFNALSHRWLNFHDHVLMVDPGSIEAYLRNMPAKERSAGLRSLLAKTVESLKAIRKTAGKLQETLEGLA